MNSSRFVEPETTTLELSEGDWILVKTRLNHGQQRAAQARTYIADAAGIRNVDPMQMDMALVTAYLLDWSLTDKQKKPVTIAGLEPEPLGRVLDNLDPESFGEIRDAIVRHVDTQRAAREAEKKTRSGESGAKVISPSPSEPAGALSGSVN